MRKDGLSYVWAGLGLWATYTICSWSYVAEVEQCGSLKWPLSSVAVSTSIHRPVHNECLFHMQPLVLGTAGNASSSTNLGLLCSGVVVDHGHCLQSSSNTIEATWSGDSEHEDVHFGWKSVGLQMWALVNHWWLF